jgi:hypothetical protein
MGRLLFANSFLSWVNIDMPALDNFRVAILCGAANPEPAWVHSPD